MEIPYVFTASEMLEYFLAAGESPSAEHIEEAGGRIGRNSFPALVADLHREGLLEAATASMVVPSAWCACEFPMVQLSKEEWGELFDWAGYTVDGVRSQRPAESLQLWRGAIPEFRDGWSWTDDRDKAQWFADRPFTGGRGRVWVATVEPIWLLARISEQRPGESEWVVDTIGVTITEAAK